MVARIAFLTLVALFYSPVLANNLNVSGHFNTRLNQYLGEIGPHNELTATSTEVSEEQISLIPEKLKDFDEVYGSYGKSLYLGSKRLFASAIIHGLELSPLLNRHELEGFFLYKLKTSKNEQRLNQFFRFKEYFLHLLAEFEEAFHQGEKDKIKTLKQETGLLEVSAWLELASLLTSDEDQVKELIEKLYIHHLVNPSQDFLDQIDELLHPREHPLKKWHGGFVRKITKVSKSASKLAAKSKNTLLANVSRHRSTIIGLSIFAASSSGLAVGINQVLSILPAMLLSTFLWTKELHFGILLWSRNFKKGTCDA